jgi:PEGA domain
MVETADDSARGSSVRTALLAPPGATFVFLVSVAVVSAVGAFAAVRAWFAPVGAAAATVATLTVETQPAGAELRIDDQPRGTTPATFSLDPGEHALAVRGAGVERTVQLTLAAGAQVAQYFDLTANARAAAPGRMSIVTDPPGVRVAVDGRARGVSPLVIDGLSAAEHTVGVMSDAGSAQRTVGVANGATTEVVFSLPRTAAPVGGWIAVSSPFPVDVLEHSEVIGTSGTSQIMLAAGAHDVVLRNDSIGFEERRKIDVVPGAVASIEVVPPTATVNVNARPWADVSIDGASAGQTPLANVALPLGPHEITFRHPQLGERTERIVVTAKGANRVAIDLTK